MKKILAILLVLMLSCMSALAFEGSGYPAYDGGPLPANAAGGAFGDSQLRMDFDPSSDFSMIYDGLAQLCFFCQNMEQSHYLELYLMLPLDLAAGDVLTQSTPGREFSITLYEVSQAGETTYYGGQFLGLPYPDGVSLEISIASAVKSAQSYALHGTINATLRRMNGGLPTDGAITLSNVEFDCTLPLSAAAGEDTPQQSPSLPAVVPEAAAPKFTLPPDYASI